MPLDPLFITRTRFNTEIDYKLHKRKNWSKQFVWRHTLPANTTPVANHRPRYKRVYVFRLFSDGPFLITI